MKIALVGTGSISETIHLPILKSLSDIEVVSICDNNQKQLTRVADKFNISRRYTDVEDMLKSEAIDVLDIATPGFTHFDIADKAISAGINIMIEKPVTLNSQQAETLKNNSEKKNLKIGIFQTLRFRDPVREFQEARREGRIGNISRIITMQRGSTIFALPSWFWDENISGGILFELGIHAVDLQCYLMGPAKKVLYANLQYDQTLKFTTSISAVIQFETGIGILDLKWFSSSNFFHQYVSASVADAIMKFIPDLLVLQQSDFAPLSECIGEVKRLWKFGHAALRKKYHQKSQLPHRLIIEDFMESLRNNRESLVPISSVIPTIQLIEKIRAYAGQTDIVAEEKHS